MTSPEALSLYKSYCRKTKILKNNQPTTTTKKNTTTTKQQQQKNNNSSSSSRTSSSNSSSRSSSTRGSKKCISICISSYSSSTICFTCLNDLSHKRKKCLQSKYVYSFAPVQQVLPGSMLPVKTVNGVKELFPRFCNRDIVNASVRHAIS